MNLDVIVLIVWLSLLLMVPLMLWGTRPSWWAVGGCLMYPASVLIANAFHIAFYVLDPLPPEYAAAMEVAMTGAPPSAYGFALRIFTASSLLLVAVYSTILFFALSRQTYDAPFHGRVDAWPLKFHDERKPVIDIQARMIWLTIALAETFAFLEYAQCKMLVDPFGSNDLHLSAVWGIEVSRYACGRVFTSWAPFMPPIVTSLYLVYVNARRRV